MTNIIVDALVSSHAFLRRLFVVLALCAAAPAFAADLQVSTYTWAPDPVPNGATTQFSVRVTNNGPGSVGDAVVTIAVSSRFRVDPGNFPSYCAVSGATGSQTLTCNLPNLAQGDFNFNYTATAIAIGSANTVATISSAIAGDANAANNSLTVTPAVQIGANLRTTKSDNLPGGTIVAGGVINYSLNVFNDGPDATNAIRVTDNLPPATDLVYQAASGTNWSCSQSGVQVVCNYTGAAVIGALPPVTVTGRVVAPTAGTITNNAFASLTSALVLDPNGANNAAPPVVTQIQPGSDLRATKTMTQQNLVGSNSTITIGIINDGPRSISGATISDTIGSYFTIGSPLPSGCSVAGQTVTCSGGTLTAGQSRNFAIPVTATTLTPGTGTQTNTATIALPAGGADPVLANNSASQTYRVVPVFADLRLQSKTKSPNPVAANGLVTSNITVRNYGPSVLSYNPAAPLRVTDQVSADETYEAVDAATPGWSCSQAALLITCQTTGTGTLAVNADIALRLLTRASATANANIVNTACTGSTAGSAASPLDPTSADNPTEQNDCSGGVGVRATTTETDLAIEKYVSLNPAGPWTASSALTVPASANDVYIRIVARNVGTASATAVVTDNIARLNETGFVTPVALIDDGNGSYAYNAGQGRVTWTLDDMAPGATEELVFRISRPVNSGTVNNTATISSPNAIDVNNANNSATASYAITPLADISVTGKSISPNPARVGVLSTYTISVRNLGANPAQAVTLTDTIDPDRFELVGSPATTKPSPASCSSNTTTGVVTCSLGTFSRTENFQITQAVRPRFPFGGATTGFPISHTNTASVTTTTEESDSANNHLNNSFSVTHSVSAPDYDLAITKLEPGPEYDPRRFGEELVYDIRVTNFGPSRATNVLVTDTPQPPAGYGMALAGFSVNPADVPANFTRYTPPAPNCVTVAAVVQCRLHGSDSAANYLDEQREVVFRLRFTPTGPAPAGNLTFTNSANIVALEQDNTTVNQADAELANNTATQQTTVIPSVDLEVVSKSRVTASPASIGQPIDYDIVIRNNGISPIAQVRVTDTLPSGFTLVGTPSLVSSEGAASVGNIACTGTQTVVCIIDGSFPPSGDRVTIRISARATDPYAGPFDSDRTNTASIAPGLDSGGQPLARDPVDANNSKTAVAQIAQSSIAGTVFADDNLNNSVQPGEGIGSVTVTLTGTDNFGNAVTRSVQTTATGSFLFDRLPAGTYTLIETQPGSYLDFNETAGAAGGTVNNAGVGSGATFNTIGAITLPLDTDATGYLFQEIRAGSIEGTVFKDANNNGVIDAGEQGVPAGEFPSTPQIRLTGTDYAGQPVNLTTIVDGAGRYSFTNLAPSDAAGYTVTQLVQPTGLSDGIDSNGTGVTVANSAGRTAPEDIRAGVLAPAAALTNRDFGEIPSSTLSGRIFFDPDQDAVRDPTEISYLAGALLRLTGTNDVGQTVDCSVTTTASGEYGFPLDTDPNPACRVLRPGTYTLTETPPPGLTHTGAFIGTASGTAGGTSGANTPVPGAGNTVVSNIVVAAGTIASNYDFGATGEGLGGYVYVDRNNNGARDNGEPGIAGVTITLSGQTAGGQDVCTLIADCTATTDVTGNYLFSNVPGSSPAGYTLREQAQASAPLNVFADGLDAAGDVAGDPRGAAGNDVITGIVLNAGDLGLNNAFGERGGSLSGAAYVDGNDDGVRQPGETVLAGIEVTLSGTTAGGQDICVLRAALDPAMTCTTTTAADGSYRFDALPGGNYTLTEAQPSLYADGRESAGTPAGSVDNGSFGAAPATNRIVAIPLGNGQDGTGYDFGERAITISGRVYLDPERDGVDDNEQGIPGVTITLRRQDGSVAGTATTVPDGSYRFENLPAGTYTVEETQPGGYGSSTPNSQSINVTAGQNQEIDFGETDSSLAGSVFVDSNNDGIRQPGERGIEGVTVRLTGTDGAGVTVDRTLTTDASGNYRFENVLGGTYAVAETQPAGFGDGSETAGTSGGTVGADAITAIALAPGLDATDYVFGELGQGQGGVVYVDLNENGVQDPGEPGIAGVTVELRKPDGSIVATTTTDPDGGYAFADVEAGEYLIVETQPGGYGNAPENPSNRVPLTVGVGRPVTPINFGETVGSIAGGVYNDSNDNGVRDPNEPVIVGVTVTLTGADAHGQPVTRTAVTGQDGNYVFTGVPGGTYQIVETQPEGYDDGKDSPGTAGGSAAGDTISAITLGANEDATGYLFGERGAGARIAGTVWFDRDHDRARDSGEDVKADWTVELLLNGQLAATTTTRADGTYAFTGIAPGTGYQVRFRNPANNAVFGSARTNETGANITEGVISPANPGGARTEGGVLSGLTLKPGQEVAQQSLPLDPAGVVYDSVRRVVVPGAIVAIAGPAGFDPALHLLGGTSNVSQVVGGDGMYQFLLLAGAPAGTYSLAVTPPNGSYNPVQPSTIIPPCAGPLTVGAAPDPMLVSAHNGAPPASALRGCAPGGDTTAYFLSFVLTPGVSANVLSNNIPIDPILEGAIEVTKTTPMVNVTRGGLVPYTVTARNTLAGGLTGITVTDRVPAGFRYREGSATVNGVPTEPVQAGRLLSWPGQNFAAAEEKTIKLILVVGAGVGEGEHVNQAYAVNPLVGTVVSNVADATVRIMPDPDFDCTDILGKAFDDVNMNGVQDQGERGIPGVRLASARGLLVTTDAQGRYHITCPMIPNEDRGSNFILKLDQRTLPTGYRMTTVNPETVRLTRGKFATLNFGAALGRVVRVDVNATAFTGEQVGQAFLGEVDKLVARLAERPSILRIAYGASGEEKDLVRRRIAALRDAIEERWEQRRDRYRLVIEEETTTPAALAQGDVK
ncbi:SdrD B-like domain-containing protein [Sphingomonas sp. DT-207]|uniref:SdrD B-like domain-containing protein n=1 Tax=Sphingomonas sp. DT-207 TaxID=3396167 RepID=UPI003F1DB379